MPAATTDAKTTGAIYTTAPIGRTMIRTGFAMLAGTLAMSGYNIVDSYFMGRLGTIPTAAMTFTFPVVMLLGCVFHGLAVGVMTTSSQALGGNKRTRAVRLVSSGLLLLTFISIALGVGGILTSHRLFQLLGAEDETLNMAQQYIDIWYFGCVTSSIGMAGNDLLIGAGDSGRASAMMVFGLIVNTILDPILIFGFGPIPKMGISGAAFATVLAQLCGMLGILWFLWKKHGLLEFSWIPFRELRSLWSLIIRYGVPSSLGMLMMPIGSFIMTWITAQFGDAVVAATGQAGRLEMIAFVFPMALGISLLPMIGQNFGARLYSRIHQCRRFAMRFAFFFLTTMAVLYFLLAPVFARWFTKDPEVEKWIVLALRIVPWCFPMIEIHRYSGFFFTGCGKPAAAAWLNAFRVLGLTVPFSFLALWLGSIPGLFLARTIADVLSGAVGFWLVRRLTRRFPQDGSPFGVPVEPVEGPLSLGLAGQASAQASLDAKSHTQ